MAEQDQKEVSEQKHHLEEKLKAEITEAKVSIASSRSNLLQLVWSRTMQSLSRVREH